MAVQASTTQSKMVTALAVMGPADGRKSSENATDRLTAMTEAYPVALRMFVCKDRNIPPSQCLLEFPPSR